MNPVHIFKPCVTCSGKLEAVTGPYALELQPGLQRVTGHVRPILVPDVQPRWTRYRWIVQCTACSTMLEYVIIQDGSGITMAEAAQPTGATDAQKPSRKELLEKVRRLSESRETVTADKKTAVADYNDQLKSINDELKDTLDILKNTPDEGAASA